MREVIERASRIRLLLLDVDGVLTEGKVLLDEEGREIKAFYVRDGVALKLLRRKGIEVGFITGRSSEAVSRRAEELGVGWVIQGTRDKVQAYERIAQETGVEADEVCFVGDDIVDIPLLKRVGLPVVVADGAEEAKRHALYVTRSPGGRGAVREVCELLLQAQGKWGEIIRGYEER